MSARDGVRVWLCFQSMLAMLATIASAEPASPSLTDDARIAAERWCAVRDSRCDWIALVGRLERASLERVVARHGYAIDAAPWGKVIGKIHIHNEDVFVEDSRFLRFFNAFHVTTRATTIAQELVIQEGEVWDQSRIEETVRRLRDPLWSSVVAVLPIASRDPTKVDLLVVTRDIWSLHLDTQYELTADGETSKLTKLRIALLENNFLGRRMVLAAAVAMDQDVVATGPIFIDKNFLGERLDLRLRGDALFNRDSLLEDGAFVREGSASTIELSKPLWSLASRWGAGGSFTHRFEIERVFRGTDLRTYDNPDTLVVEMLPHVYRSRTLAATASVTRQWGARFKHRLSAGFTAASQRPTPYRFEGDAIAQAAFVRDVLPRSEVTSGPYVELAGFEPTYKTLRNLQTYDLGEDTRFGPDYGVVFGAGARFLGSTASSLRASATLGWTVPVGRDGMLRATAGMNVRYEPTATAASSLVEDLIDNTAFVRLRLATPACCGGRLVFQTALSTRWHDTQNRFYTIGADTGLRGFLIDEFQGQRVFSTQLEARSDPLAFWILRLGLVAFYEVGGAADSLRHLPLYQDLGLGLRTLIPHTSRDLFRFDVAFPLDGPDAGTVRVLAGLDSAF